MTFRPVRALIVLPLVLAACGSSKPPRMTLHTPDVKTGAANPEFPLASPTPAETPKPDPTPKPKGGPVTSTEKRIIKNWADELRHGKAVYIAQKAAHEPSERR